MKKIKNTYEIMDLDELISNLKKAETELDVVIPKFKKYQDLVEAEFKKWDMNETPNPKNLEKYIKEQEPIMKEYRATFTKLNDIKKEIIHKTGVKEQELKDFYKFYKFKKILDQLNGFTGVL